jgi:hypothetical protein
MKPRITVITIGVDDLEGFVKTHRNEMNDFKRRRRIGYATAWLVA